MIVDLIQQTPNPIDHIARIASICYDSKPRCNEALVRKLYESGHHSVFEHVYFTFYVAGISRACSHQLVRHRMCSFTQRSQRYCSEAGGECVYPPTITGNDFAMDTYDDAIDGESRAYSRLVLNGVPKEDARYLIPNACCTSMYISCNLRELMHIANERLCSRAQWEIRSLVGKLVELVDPALSYMLVPRCKSGLYICNQKCEEGK